MQAATDADRAVVEWFARNRNAALTSLFRVVGNAGAGGIPWAAAAALAGARRGNARGSALGAGAAFGAFVGSLGLARVVERGRPCHRGLHAEIDCPDGPSFPSDQVAASFAGAVFIARTLPALAIPAFTIATLVGAGRVYLGVHYPSDVVGGAIAGAAIGAGCAAAAT